MSDVGRAEATGLSLHCRWGREGVQVSSLPTPEGDGTLYRDSSM